MRQIHDFSSSYPYLQQQMQRRRFEFRHPTEEKRQYINNLQDTADRSITRIQCSYFLHHQNRKRPEKPEKTESMEDGEKRSEKLR